MESYEELLTQRDELDQKIEVARKAQLANAITQVKTLIKKYKLTAADCGFTAEQVNTSEKATKTVQPKYVTPDGLHHWTGRGNPPVAFKALFDAGHKKEDFLIKKDSA